ncbi:acyltransferase domain-containing protein [Lipingzhangella sp. LS1_29]|uniref:Malonyl CoA-acyl carrier protein transacylase n=1 Tax=Lipingzhangella rawalii TaxID=2055835 RepID=A0ABU2H8X3_9ACTN|nr:acyltransferase domain-containing protein [Lipingzhangella rawalii]MDS1271054.1 acyltransferase domain-containing protein [Lipingzhangella rawalii]
MTFRSTTSYLRVLMFPGQGGQRRGMGSELLENPSSLIDEADDILDYSVRELCLSDPHGALEDSRYAQPAVYVTNALAYRNYLKHFAQPDVLIGHSLGEYNALEAAGVLDFATGLRLVQTRAQVTTGRPGAMLAVVGLTIVEINSVLEQAELSEIEPANLNSRFQSVLGGPVDQINTARSALQSAGAKLTSRLRITGAFHTRHMRGAANEFRIAMPNFNACPGKTPVIANLTARPYQNLDVRDALVAHLTHPVLWQHSIEEIIDRWGRPELPGDGVLFDEIGSEQVLTRLVTHIRRDRATSIQHPYTET